jgi:hypothetical protein
MGVYNAILSHLGAKTEKIHAGKGRNLFHSLPLAEEIRG